VSKLKYIDLCQSEAAYCPRGRLPLEGWPTQGREHRQTVCQFPPSPCLRTDAGPSPHRWPPGWSTLGSPGPRGSVHATRRRGRLGSLRV